MSNNKNIETSDAIRTSDAKKQPEKVIYMGPTIRGVANQGTVFDGGIPLELEEKAKKIPAVRALIIPLKNLSKASAELAVSGSALNTLYKKIESTV